MQGRSATVCRGAFADKRASTVECPFGLAQDVGGTPGELGGKPAARKAGLDSRTVGGDRIGAPHRLFDTAPQAGTLLEQVRDPCALFYDRREPAPRATVGLELVLQQVQQEDFQPAFEFAPLVCRQSLQLLDQVLDVEPIEVSGAKVGRLLAEIARETDLVARYGGEEFVVILSNTGIAAGSEAAERLRSKIETEQWPHRAVTVSIGMATWEDGMKSASELIERADQAMYYSKQHGRNRVTHWLDIGGDSTSDQIA